MEKKLALAKIQYYIERLYYKTFAWLIPLCVMLKTCEALVPFEVKHPVLSRVGAIAVALVMFVVGRCFEQSLGKHLEKRQSKSDE